MKRRKKWWGRERRSKDGRVNKEGRKMIDFIEERGWCIFNGTVRGDEEGEYTFTGGKGSTVIDYVLGDEARDKIEKMGGDRVDSDHHPVDVWMKGRMIRRIKGKKGNRGGRGIWGEKGTRCSRRSRVNMRRRDVGEEWNEMGGRLREAIKDTEEELDGGRREKEAGGMKNVRGRKRK